MQLAELVRNLPVIDLQPDDVLVREGEHTSAVFVLDRGALSVTRGGMAIAEIATPGSFVGEIAALVGGDHSATVTATAPSRLWRADDGAAFLRSSPDIAVMVATEVAHRLQSLVAYLADLKRQYDGAPGLDMVDGVLTRLAQQARKPAQPGSAREPDPLY
jgi:CRP/FNR family transcriptional regulator, cyclic AMP receptor protein